MRRERDSVLYLSELRQQKRTTLTLRAPLAESQSPAAVAAQATSPGEHHGVDYRGQAVLAAWHPVAGTPWVLVAKMNRDEARAPARAMALWISGIAGAAAAVLAFSLLLLMREQRTAQRLALRVQADSLMRPFYEMPFVGMAVIEPVTFHWLQFNDHLCTLSGYAREELQARTWTSFVHLEDLPQLAAETERMMRGESDGYAQQARFIRKDGSVRATELDVKCVRRADGAVEHFIATVQDITERKATEEKVLQLNRLYATLSGCNTAIVHCQTEEELFAEICRVAVETGGMRLAAVGLLDRDSARVRWIASRGAGAESLVASGIVTDSADAYGRGPTGTALREGEPVWVEDFLADPRTAPWHTLGQRHGWGASAALPLRLGALTVGAFTLCMAEPNSLDNEVRALLVEIATDLSFALANFERETVRRKAVENLAESEERYRLLFENSKDAILLSTAPEGRILEANAAACRIFGRSKAQLLQARRADLVDPADPREQQILEERARTGAFSGELTLVRGDGSRFPAEVASVEFRNRQGEARASTIVRDISERKRLEHLAEHDALTGLPNRVLFSDRLELALAHARRAGKRVAVMFMDLDRFKNINDSLGHELGDQLLREAAARLKSAVRATDTVSRQGGDEFLVILPELDGVDDAARVATKLTAAMAKPFRLGDAEVVISISIGIASSPEDGTDPDTLLRNSDAALYFAKDAGRNRYQFYSAEMNARTRDRLALEGDLRRAVELGQLFLAYQPQVDLGTGRVAGVEALVRWRHPARGVVPPGEFIHIAEDSGLIGEIGAWVLETACRQHVAWLAQDLISGSVAVNVSAHQFRQPGFVDEVAAVLARTGLQADRLELEVTETVVMRGSGEVLARLQSLHDIGVRLALDDFGTGYSSLSYLRQFPIHRLKIDQSFTRSLPADGGSSAIAQAIISMGHSLGMTVLAEGVETSAQAEHLQQMWCDAAQGYLYSRPLPAEEFSDFLRRQKKASPSNSTTSEE